MVLVATAPIRSLAWKPPYAAGAAPEKTISKYIHTYTHTYIADGGVPAVTQRVKDPTWSL